MSQIKIEANPSGGGIYTLQSGAGSTDRTITLPDKAGEVAVGAGTIVQVVSSEGSTTDTTSTSSALSLHTQAITPTSSSNKILVICSVASERTSTTTTHFWYAATLRDSTTISQYWGNAMNYGQVAAARSHATSSILDSPATTSSITYKIEADLSNGGGSRFLIYKPVLTLLEVVA